MPSNRHSAKHRRPKHRRHSGQGRRGQARRLTLAVAAATTAVAGAAATGVALAAGPADGATGGHHLAAATAARPAVSLATGAGASGRAAAQSASRQAVHRPATRTSTRATPKAQPSPSPTHPTPSGQTQPYLVYDSVVPSALPTGHTIAVYATGGRPAQPSELAGRGPVLWIDVVGTDPGADVLDVEPGCVGPAAVPSWVSQRLTARPGALAIIYTTIGEWSAVRAEVASLPAAMQAKVRWWIADPTGYAHVVPGSDATQWYWGSHYDISTATPRL